ncbi:MAG: succinate dehydrogenase flavoprotein subunit [Myxococcales bacterium]|nr:succinate dehydrogenase flavoprotein subunit [Myxococcota bacterium]MDW8282538.1 succinate dehydrogenase flavoprotein subunit [Myxococcales bacterium]
MAPSRASDRPRFLVVGGGLAGLMTVIKIAEAGHDVDVFSLVPCRRSHSVCAQGGINGAVNTKGEGDSPELHFMDTIKGGDFLADQPPVRSMCQAAPGLIYLLDRMGVPFTRTREGLIDFRRFGGTLHHRTAFAGATTGQQILYALDEQVRRLEAQGRVRRFENHEMVSLVRDETGRCRGIVVVDLRTMEVQAHAGACVALATGGLGLIFGKSTNSSINTGSAASIAYQQGARYANGEFIQVHPTSIPGSDKLRLMSESLRGEGGRIWVPKDRNDRRRGEDIPEGERYYFLEEKYPVYGNLVPRDIASREIFDVVVNQGMGVGGERFVYLDLTHLPPERHRKLQGVLEMYEKYIGEDPRKVPMKVFPAVHYSMGGLWVDYDQQTNIPGLFAVGECDFAFHGANRLGANSLLSCLYSGTVAGPAMIREAAGVSSAVSSALLEAECRRVEAELEWIRRLDGPENPYRLWTEMGEMMTENATVVRDNRKLQATDERLVEMMERLRRCAVLDTGRVCNHPLMFIRQLWNMLVLARVIVRGALLRDESRGAHYKPEFPQRDDARFLQHTVAEYAGGSLLSGEGAPRISYAPVDTSLIKPVLRDYSRAPEYAPPTASI